MAARPWMPFYVADYRADTAHLSAAQHGAYLLLIMHYWMTGGLPPDDAALARIACMTPAEWRKSRPTIAAFFSSDWKHKRIEFELTEAQRISEAGRIGGKASAAARRAAKEQREANEAATIVQRPLNERPAEPQALKQPQPHPQRYSGPDGPAADAPRDVRAELFKSGLKTLAEITGKTPDSCRSLVGKWLKSVNDEAIHVLAAIDDAARNRVADPVAWINRALSPRQGHHDGQPRKRTVMDAADDLIGDLDRRIAEAEARAAGQPAGQDVAWLLPPERGG